MKSRHAVVRRLRRVLGLKADLRLDKRLAGMEHVFHAPPLTEELASAIRLISPQFPVSASEGDRTFWEADQNGACWGEFEALEPVLRGMEPPRKVLEIGCGLGRSLVFFSKELGWAGSMLHGFDGDGSRTRYTIQGPRFADSFCGNLEQLRLVLDYNGLQNVTLHDAKEVALNELPGPFDFLYSFYSVGFHWALEHFLGDIVALMDERSVAVFTVPLEFRPFSELEGLAYRLIEWKPVWPLEARLKLLVLGLRKLPEF